MAVGGGPFRSSSSQRSTSRSSLVVASAWLLTLALVALPSRVSAEQAWSVGGGRVIFDFNVPYLHDLGLDFTVGAGPVPEHDADTPRWSFPVRAGSDFRFRTEYGIALPAGSPGGALRLDATITVRDRRSGRQTRFTDLEIVQLPAPGSEVAAAEDGPPLVLRSASSGLVFCQLVSAILDFRPKEKLLRIHYLNARLAKEWAAAIGRPDLAGLVIGGGELRGGARLLSSTAPTRPRHPATLLAGVKDVALGALSSIQQVGHIGTFPTGTTGMALSTTSCNLGTADVPWLGPMQTDHPMIEMAIYRLLNGRFEQIGVSWLKHGFFAQSNHVCSTCQNPSDGSFLGVGCSDTYGVNNNEYRDYLGPRSETNPFTGIWNCVGSWFSGGQPDCIRRQGAANVSSSVAHRLAASDADLGNAGATYYYEAAYIVRADVSIHNNWGSRLCTMSWNGSSWTFTTPSTGNALVSGPALERWGDLRTYAQVAADDGQVLLATQATALGGGMYHYEYALFNQNSGRAIRSFSLPIAGVSTITNIGFHDNDNDASTDWSVTVDPGAISWHTATYGANPAAPALGFGTMVNFRFDAHAAPSSVTATMGIFKPGVGTEISAATTGPFNSTTGVEASRGGGLPRITGIRPNPTTRSATIAFTLPKAGSARLEIYDAQGRRVRTLMDQAYALGPQTLVWDGRAENGTRVFAGVYHVRLEAGGITIAKPLVVVK